MRGDYLLVDDRVRFTKDLASFTMADNHILDEELSEHRRADLAGIGAGFFEVEVLRAEANFLRSVKEL